MNGRALEVGSGRQQHRVAPYAWTLLRQFRPKLVAARLVVSFLAVAATVSIFPRITIRGEFWIWCAILGAVFGLLNAFVKPVLQALVIRYLFLSYGLILILINMATFWLLDVLTGNHLDIETFWDLLGGSLVIAILATLISTLIGATPPIVDYQAGPEQDAR